MRFGTSRGLKGVHGVASELLTVPADLEGIVNALLGRSLVVDDLDVARACLPHLPSGWNAVTLTGEIARTVGSVTGRRGRAGERRARPGT